MRCRCRCQCRLWCTIEMKCVSCFPTMITALVPGMRTTYQTDLIQVLPALIVFSLYIPCTTIDDYYNYYIKCICAICYAYCMQGHCLPHSQELCKYEKMMKSKFDFGKYIPSTIFNIAIILACHSLQT